MFTIHKLRDDATLDFAAQELQEYLLMMMPEGGCSVIRRDPDAVDGFRLGLLEDFGLPNEAADPALDDIVHIETDENGGILAGSNPRSVLFAVYRLLKENGCRFLYPGADGEYIPIQPLRPVSYHKIADHRMRGFCDEGSEYQQSMLDAIDFYAKLELNCFSLEWFIPNGYYTRYYLHMGNPNRTPEEVTDATILQWRRQCEVELNKRGMVIIGIGHGWTARPFGFPDSNKAVNVFEGLDQYTPEQKSVLAMRNGVREFHRKAPLYTNLCMSNPDVRSRVADEVVSFAEAHPNYTYLNIALADGNNNHCECDECQKMRPTDYYLMILNEIDEKLTAKGMDTRLVFISYLDTFFAPEKVKLNNPDRFTMMYCPISRDYCSSIGPDSVIPEAKPYIRNNWARPTSTEECYAYLLEWQKQFQGTVYTFEYHFWRHQYLDPGQLAIAKRIYEDVRSLKFMGMDGYIEDGSQRSFFPNGFLVYVYAAALLDAQLEFDALAEDYYSHVYGKDWEKVYAILQQVSRAFDFAYMEGVRSKNTDISLYYDPDRVSRLDAVHDMAAQLRSLAARHKNMPNRPQTVTWRMLQRYTEYLDRWAEVVKTKAMGHNFVAKELVAEFKAQFGKYELEMEPYYDHGLACRVLEHITSGFKGVILE